MWGGHRCALPNVILARLQANWGDDVEKTFVRIHVDGFGSRGAIPLEGASRAPSRPPRAICSPISAIILGANPKNCGLNIGKLPLPIEGTRQTDVAQINARRMPADMMFQIWEWDVADRVHGNIPDLFFLPLGVRGAAGFLGHRQRPGGRCLPNVRSSNVVANNAVAHHETLNEVKSNQM